MSAGIAPGSWINLPDRSPAWYGDWLRHGFLAHEAGVFTTAALPFEGADMLIGDHRLLVEYLVLFHGLLPPLRGQREALRGGMVHAMRRLDLSAAHDRIIADRLLALARQTGVTDAIHILGAMVAAAPAGEETNRLVRAVVDAVAARPLPRSAEDPAETATGEDTRSVLYGLISLPGFGVLQARQSLKALCKADPAGLVEHLIRLHHLLQPRYAASACGTAASPRWLERRDRVLDICEALAGHPMALQLAFEAWWTRPPGAGTRAMNWQSQDWLCGALADEACNDAVQAALPIHYPEDEPGYEAFCRRKLGRDWEEQKKLVLAPLDADAQKAAMQAMARAAPDAQAEAEAFLAGTEAWAA